MRKKIAIICPAELPVPSVKGGAVETLIDHFLDENEKRGEQALEIIVYSVYDINAELESKKYKNSPLAACIPSFLATLTPLFSCCIIL